MRDLPVAIGYSGGASSEWLVRAVINGRLPRPAHVCVVTAIMPEHSWTFAAIDEVEAACLDAKIEFIRCQADTSLADDLLALGSGVTRIDQPPLWISKGLGRGRAQHRCTKHYKVAPMRRVVSTWLDRIGKPKKVEKWIGFGVDEAMRATKAVQGNDVQWEHLEFPAINLGLSRAQQRAEVEKWTGRTPRFSMCVFCPFKSPRRWMQTTGEDLALAVRVDEAIRDLDCIGLTDGPAYLTDRLIPVADLVRNGDPQPELPGFESYCDSGACFL